MLAQPERCAGTPNGPSVSVSPQPGAAPLDPGPLPSGTVTFLFTDIEASTQRWERDRAAMSAAVMRHDAIVRREIEGAGGSVFKTVGDAFCAAFTTAPAALKAALAVQRALGAETWPAVDGLRVRAALHTGDAEERGGDYFGPAVNRVARLLATGHGGHILCSGVTSALVRDALPAGAELCDLGVHRLRDLGVPERIFALVAPGLRTDVPPLRSLSALPNNLPVAVTSFIGREREIDELKALLREERLVTLVGAGGIGKSRISLQVAADFLETKSDGVWFVELAPLSDAARLAQAIATVVGVRLTGDGDSRADLTAALRAKHMLLILDNCEHLIDGIAPLAAAILRGCPDVTLLASSRQSLGIAGETAYRVGGLDTPPRDGCAAAPLAAAQASTFEAVALFVERARSADSRFGLTDANAPIIADIVGRLDGIALAIELAAARVKLLAPPQLRARLDERFRLLTGGSRDVLPRQQTLRALIDWSYDLLDDSERMLFRRLSIFVDGFTLEAVCAVCADENHDELASLDVLASLVDKSLVVAEIAADTTRYHLLESTRAYALERLLAAGERDVCARRFASHVAALFDDAEARLDATGSDAALTALWAERENVRAVLDWATANDVFVAARILAACGGRYWIDVGATDGLWRAQRTLEVLPADAASPRARLLSMVSNLSFHAARFAAASSAGSEGIAEARRAADHVALFRALLASAIAVARMGRCDDAYAALSEAEQLAEGAPTPASRVKLHQARALVAALAGDLEGAKRAGETLRTLALSIGNSDMAFIATLNLAEDEFASGNVERAIALGRELLPTDFTAARRAEVRMNLAAYLAASGDADQACRMAGEALQLGVLSEEKQAQVLSHLALALTTKDVHVAAQIAGFADAHMIVDELEYTERSNRERTNRLLAAKMDPGEIARLRAEGAALTLAAATAEALGSC